MSPQGTEFFALILLLSVWNFSDARILNGPKKVEDPAHEYKEQIKGLMATVTLEIDARLQPIWERLQNAEHDQLPQVVTDFRDIISEMLDVMEYVVEYDFADAHRERDMAHGADHEDYTPL